MRNRPLTDLTAIQVREMLNYNPDTGEFTWKVSNSNRVKVGDSAQSISVWGYARIGINGKRYPAHRIAWLYVTGKWPKRFIDHLNGDRADNRFANLRCASDRENATNKRIQSNNRSGFKGVFPCRKKWHAMITINKKRMYLGTYDTPEDAHQAYCEAAPKYHGQFANPG